MLDSSLKHRQHSLSYQETTKDITESTEGTHHSTANSEIGLCVKLDSAMANGSTVEMAEEFRTLTLQVIAEALLSLSPEEKREWEERESAEGGERRWR